MALFSSRRRRSSNTTPADEPASSATPPSPSRGTPPLSSRSAGHSESSMRSRDSFGNGSTRSNDGRAAGGKRSRGFFRRRRASPSDRHGDLARDQTLMNVRNKVADAEGAERQADAALSAARAAVSEARDQVKSLEREAVEESKRAKMKQAEVKNVRKSARHLGRHDRG
ncbi:hypothetical protein BJV74DRAFT_882513 [Russula compacta]|nr:hypothetical protein BJV74DRAFT_882513 [Russula compacta]